jgi:hypothetical protein
MSSDKPLIRNIFPRAIIITTNSQDHIEKTPKMHVPSPRLCTRLIVRIAVLFKINFPLMPPTITEPSNSNNIHFDSDPMSHFNPKPSKPKPTSVHIDAASNNCILLVEEGLILHVGIGI